MAKKEHTHEIVNDPNHNGRKIMKCNQPGGCAMQRSRQAAMDKAWKERDRTRKPK